MQHITCQKILVSPYFWVKIRCNCDVTTSGYASLSELLGWLYFHLHPGHQEHYLDLAEKWNATETSLGSKNIRRCDVQKGI